MIYVNGRFLTQKMTGVQRFAFEICKALIELRQDIIFLVPKEISLDLVPKYFNIEIIGKSSGLFWEQIELPCFLKKKVIHYL